jgi:WD40 repeat protein
LVTCSSDRTTKVWNVATAQLLVTLPALEKEVVRGAFGPDGRQLATCGLDGSVRVWEVATGKPLTVPLPVAGR